MSKTIVRRILASMVVGGAIVGASALADPPHAKADNATTIPGCVTAPWGFLGSQVRIICDGPLNPDGSWTRERAFVIPAHRVPFTCHTYGGSYSSTTTCDGGYDVDLKTLGDETYPVTPDTVLGDEPAWIAH